MTVAPDPLTALNARPVATQTARIEIYPFESLTLTDKQFLTGGKDGTRANIAGELRLPVGTAKIPAVILVHGSGGLGANVDQWASHLNGIGVAAFVVDSFTGRGITQTITDQSLLGSLTMIVDAYRALEILAKHARIDEKQIALMGFSKGGFVALYAGLKRFQRMYAPAGLEFCAYIPFYAPCNIVFLEDEEVSERPIRLFHGAADNYVSVGPCRKYVERLQKKGHDVRLTEYPGAQHVFDNPLYTPECFIAEAVTTSECLREERAGGEIVNLATGEEFHWDDPGVRRGASVCYHPAATAQAKTAVLTFLRDLFRLNA